MTTRPGKIRLKLSLKAIAKRCSEPEPEKEPPFAEEFRAIWKRYPKRVGQTTAFDAYVARRREGVPARKLWEATVLYAEQRQGEDTKFTLLGKTFFGPNGRWKEPFEIKEGNGHTKHRQPPLDLQKLFAESDPPEPEPEEDDDPLADL